MVGWTIDHHWQQLIFSGSVDGDIRIWRIPMGAMDPYDSFDSTIQLPAYFQHTDAVWSLCSLVVRHWRSCFCGRSHRWILLFRTIDYCQHLPTALLNVGTSIRQCWRISRATSNINASSTHTLSMNQKYRLVLAWCRLPKIFLSSDLPMDHVESSVSRQSYWNVAYKSRHKLTPVWYHFSWSTVILDIARYYIGGNLIRNLTGISNMFPGCMIMSSNM